MECWKLSNLENYSFQTFIDNLGNFQRCEWTVLGIAALLFLFLLLLARKQPRTIPAFRNDSGKTEITRKALEELVKNICSQFPAVRKSKSTVKLKRGYLHLLIKVKIEGSTSLQEVTSTLQSQLHDVLANQMGITKMGKINVSVIGIKSYGSSAKPVVTDKIEEPDPEITEDSNEDLFDSDPEDPKENKF